MATKQILIVDARSSGPPVQNIIRVMQDLHMVVLLVKKDGFILLNPAITKMTLGHINTDIV